MSRIFLGSTKAPNMEEDHILCIGKDIILLGSATRKIINDMGVSPKLRAGKEQKDCKGIVSFAMKTFYEVSLLENKRPHITPHRGPIQEIKRKPFVSCDERQGLVTCGFEQRLTLGLGLRALGLSFSVQGYSAFWGFSGL